MTRLPPGPRRSPWQLYRYIRDQSQLWMDCARTYGDPFTVQSPFGVTVVTGDPEGIQQIFAADPDLFEMFPAELFGAFLGYESLFALEGERHRRRRKVLLPPFHGARVRACGTIMRDVALRAAAGWRPGVPFVMLEEARHISLQVILRSLFGAVGEQRLAMLQDAILAMFDSAHPLIMFLPALRRELFGLGPWARLMRRRKRLHRLIDQEIQQRRKGGVEEDILSLMMAARYDDGHGMSDEELRDELLTIVSAGHESTATMLTWSLYEIERHPAVRERLMAEIDGLGPAPEPEALAELPYLDAVCSEVLRLHPIGSGVGRRLRGPMTLRDYELPAGTVLSASVLLAHSNARIYPEPTAFRPERFLERKYGPAEYLPFGGGMRRCLGAAFAAYELKVLLATLLQNTYLRLVSQDAVRTVRQSVMVGPEGGVPVVYQGPRTPPALRTSSTPVSKAACEKPAH